MSFKYKMYRLRMEWEENGVKGVLSELWFDIKYPFKQAYYGIENIVTWIPLLWNDRDWDHTFLFRVLELKLRRMAKHQREHKIHVGYDARAKEIEICAALCKRIYMDEYDDILRRQMGREYGLSSIVTYDVGMESFRGLDVEWETAPRGSERQIEAREKSVDISRKAEEQMERDLEFLFTKMRKEVRRWWC